MLLKTCHFGLNLGIPIIFHNYMKKNNEKGYLAHTRK